jgi:hypothetical protein
LAIDPSNRKWPLSARSLAERTFDNATAFVLDGSMRIAIRGLERDGNHVTVRLAWAEEGDKCLELANTKLASNLPVAILGTNAEIVDEHVDDDTGEWVIRFKLPGRSAR